MTTHSKRIEVEATLRLALEALEWFTAAEQGEEPPITKTITAIKEALMSFQDGAQPEQEPVAIYQLQKSDGSWIDQDKGSYRYNSQHGHTVRIVYTTPPTQQSCSQRRCNVKPWVSLTDEEIIDCAADLLGDVNALLVIYFTRAIEDKLKAKNERKEKNNHE